MQNRRCGARAEGACTLCRAARRKSLRSRVNAKCRMQNAELTKFPKRGNRRRLGYFFAKRETKTIDKFPKGKIGGGLGNFVRYAVAESAAYLGVCEHLRRK